MLEKTFLPDVSRRQIRTPQERFIRRDLASRDEYLRQESVTVDSRRIGVESGRASDIPNPLLARVDETTKDKPRPCGCRALCPRRVPNRREGIHDFPNPGGTVIRVGRQQFV